MLFEKENIEIFLKFHLALLPIDEKKDYSSG